MSAATGPGGSQPDPTVRSRVLDAFVNLVAEKGLAHTSIDDVAAAAGISKTTLYTRWPDRKSLIIDGFRYVASAVPAEPEDDHDLVARFRGRLDAMLDATATDHVKYLRRQLLADLLANAGIDDDIRDVLTENRQHWEDAVREMIELGKQAGEVPVERDTKVAAEVVMAVVPMRQLYGLPVGQPLHDLVYHLLTADRPY